jgi:hypothetical protein
MIHVKMNMIGMNNLLKQGGRLVTMLMHNNHNLMRKYGATSVVIEANEVGELINIAN